MKNTYLRDQTKWSQRRVPRKNGSLRYIALDQLPPGVKVLIETDDFLPEKEERRINGKEEIDVLRLKSGVYELQTDIWSTIYLTPFEHGTVALKPLYRLLAPGSSLQANVDLPVSPRGHNDPWSLTYRLVSGIITKITIPVADLILEDNKCLTK